MEREKGRKAQRDMGRVGDLMEGFWVIAQDQMDENRFEEMIHEPPFHWLEMFRRGWLSLLKLTGQPNPIQLLNRLNSLRVWSPNPTHLITRSRQVNLFMTQTYLAQTQTQGFPNHAVPTDSGCTKPNRWPTDTIRPNKTVLQFWNKKKIGELVRNRSWTGPNRAELVGLADSGPIWSGSDRYGSFFYYCALIGGPF